MVPPPASPTGRDRLLAAAARCFAEAGIDGTSTAEICRTAGVSTGLLFHHFESKQGLVLALVDKETRDIGSVPIPTRPAAARDTLFALLQAACEQADDPVSGPLALEIARAAHRDASVAAATHASDLALRELCGRLAAAGASPVGPEVAGTWIAAIVDGVFSRAANQPGFRARERSDELRRLVSAFLGW